VRFCCYKLENAVVCLYGYMIDEGVLSYCDGDALRADAERIKPAR